MGYFGTGPIMASALQVFANFYEERGKPAFDIASVDGRRQRRTRSPRSVVLEKPFGALRHFRREGLPEDAPKLLIVAPMSGHYATLLRGTVARMVENQEVWITDWADAKMVPLERRPFRPRRLHRLPDRVPALHRPRTRTCSRCASRRCPAFAATAVMGADEGPVPPGDADDDGRPGRHPRQPDLGQRRRGAPAARRGSSNNVIATVPLNYPGGGRQVYPGFLQLAGFLSMNLESHMLSHYEMFKHLTARRPGKRRRDQAVLRRVPLGLRHDRRVLPADDRARVPEALAAQGRVRPPRQADRSRRDPRHRAAGDRGRARRHLGHRPDPRRARPRRRTCRRRRRSTTSPRTSATTASSTAASGARASRRWSRTGSGRTRALSSRPEALARRSAA